MTTAPPDPAATGSSDERSGIRVACPRCKSPFASLAPPLRCASCGADYRSDTGFPDLIVGDRFPDALSTEELEYEEAHCSHTTRAYWAPLFERVREALPRRPRVLALGCGVGVEVDLLCESGFDCIGVDNGNRTARWRHRASRDRLLLANGMSLPFENATFDIVFCGCVFPHIGVVGDTFKVRPDFRAERARLAAEISRVVKPGGRIFAASPNRLFPLDLFHGRKPGSFRPRWSPPMDPFLLSVSDYRHLFSECGCPRTQALPPRGYWMFQRSQSTLKGRALTLPVRGLFSLTSMPIAPILHGSPVTPWIVVSAQKSR